MAESPIFEERELKPEIGLKEVIDELEEGAELRDKQRAYDKGSPLGIEHRVYVTDSGSFLFLSTAGVNLARDIDFEAIVDEEGEIRGFDGRDFVNRLGTYRELLGDRNIFVSPDVMDHYYLAEDTPVYGVLENGDIFAARLQPYDRGQERIDSPEVRNLFRDTENWLENYERFENDRFNPAMLPGFAYMERRNLGLDEFIPRYSVAGLIWPLGEEIATWDDYDLDLDIDGWDDEYGGAKASV